MPNILIQQVVQGPVSEKPFTSHGTTVSPVAWLVNGIVDGNAMQGIKLRAFSQKVLQAVVAGNTVVCDPPKTHKGQVEYKITTPTEVNGFVNTMPHAGGTPVQQQMPMPQPMPQFTPPPMLPQVQQQFIPRATPSVKTVPRYTLEEIEDIFLKGFEFAQETLGKKTDPDVLVKFMATYVIQLCKEGVKIPVVRTGAAMQEPPLISDMAWKTLSDNAMEQRAINCKITDDLVSDWWKSAGGNVGQFLVRANYELGKIEAGAADNIPM